MKSKTQKRNDFVSHNVSRYSLGIHFSTMQFIQVFNNFGHNNQYRFATWFCLMYTLAGCFAIPTGPRNIGMYRLQYYDILHHACMPPSYDCIVRSFC
jgi:hypothetical protein